MRKHLTLDDRIEIQMGLKAGENFTTIADCSDSDRTTVSREVKARRIPVHNSKGNNCVHRTTCRFPEACSKCTPGRCEKWNGQAPLDLFKIYGQETAAFLGLEKIPSDSINLTPALLKK